MRKSTRLYVTFVWSKFQDSETPGETPGEIFTVVDLDDKSTVEALAKIEKRFKKQVTTRNWNRIKRIGDKLASYIEA